MLEKWKQRAFSLNVKKTVITFIVVALVVIGGFSAILYANFGSRAKQWEQQAKQQEELDHQFKAERYEKYGHGEEFGPEGRDYDNESGHDTEDSSSETEAETENGAVEKEFNGEGSDAFDETDKAQQGEQAVRGSKRGKMTPANGKFSDNKETLNQEAGSDSSFDSGYDPEQISEHDSEDLWDQQFTTGDKALVIIAGIAGVLLLIWYWILCMIWAYRKATRLGFHGAAWVVITLFLNLISIMILYIVGWIKGTCQKCGKLRAHNENFCERCGAPFEKECPNCGHMVKARAKFCPNCGKKLDNDQKADTDQKAAGEGNVNNNAGQENNHSEPEEKDKTATDQKSDTDPGKESTAE